MSKASDWQRIEETQRQRGRQLNLKVPRADSMPSWPTDLHASVVTCPKRGLGATIGVLSSTNNYPDLWVSHAELLALAAWIQETFGDE